MHECCLYILIIEFNYEHRNIGEIMKVFCVVLDIFLWRMIKRININVSFNINPHKPLDQKYPKTL